MLAILILMISNTFIYPDYIYVNASYASFLSLKLL
jgi:hypothetical protein